MSKLKFEYIWLDGNKPLPHIRCKTTVRDADDFDGTIDSLPEWSFDGSSTHQAEGNDLPVCTKLHRLKSSVMGSVTVGLLFVFRSILSNTVGKVIWKIADQLPMLTRTG